MHAGSMLVFLRIMVADYQTKAKVRPTAAAWQAPCSKRASGGSAVPPVQRDGLTNALEQWKLDLAALRALM